MRLADLDPQTRALLLETCGGREALAGVLLDRIASVAVARHHLDIGDAAEQAAEKAVAAERERVAAHLGMAERAGWPLALDAIRGGQELLDVFPDYITAARERADGPTLKLIRQQETK